MHAVLPTDCPNLRSISDQSTRDRVFKERNHLFQLRDFSTRWVVEDVSYELRHKRVVLGLPAIRLLKAKDGLAG
jgi:hypothetical protein